MLMARGRVLVSGLGLGCVVRGLLANPKVCHVTCVENSPDVLKLVGPHLPADRLTIVEADALEWTCEALPLLTTRYDFAWHDIWTDRAAGEPHLDLWHTRLLCNCADYVTFQGAWSYDRVAKRLLKRRGKRVRLIA